mmetsp:Transcript_37661/g.66222  ORF Transcript_37661/g.66222 Transcript_37661/m.66222 type:complete len:136 (-) Transcript_37661:46-453(-)
MLASEIGKSTNLEEDDDRDEIPSAKTAAGAEELALDDVDFTVDLEAPREFVVEINRNKGQKLGIDVDYGNGVTLKVRAVNYGLVSDWNVAEPLKRLEVNDSIISINDVKDNAEHLVNQIVTAERLVMTVKKADTN